MMTKHWALAAALLSLAVTISCSSAHGPTVGAGGVQVVVSDANNLIVLYPSEQESFTAKVTGTSNTAVTWSLSQNGSDCTTNQTLCGSLSATSGSTVTYTAPDQNHVPPAAVSVMATSQADTTQSDFIALTINHITVQITPNNASLGAGLTQQFTAVVLPVQAPQSVAWSIQSCSGSCGSINANSGLYSGTGATDGSTFFVQAAVPASLDASGFGQAGQTAVASRLVGSTTYAFRFTGFNGATKLPTAFVGNFTVGADGKTISSGVWDELTSGGPHERSLTGNYTPNPNSQNPPDTNNQGTLTLNPQGISAFTFNVVFDAAGDMQMIEADGNGTGSGVIEPVSGKFISLGSLSGSFVFGVTGATFATGARVGYGGLVTLDGAGNIGAPGLMDVNETGTSASASDITGTYTFISNGIYSMTINSATLGATFKFRLYAVSGQSKSGNNPATLYAISTDSGNPGVSGTMVAQDPKIDPTLAGLKNTAIMGLTGADNGGSNVSLTLANFDGKGGISGQFDHNDAGTIVSISSFSGYTYTAPGNARFIINLLGNPSANPPVPPIPFVFYASGLDRGFLVDQSSGSVITGTMTPQKSPTGGYSGSELPSTYAAASTSCAVNDVGMAQPCAIVANLLLTCGGGNCAGPFFTPPGTFNVGGTEYNVNGALATVVGSFDIGSSGAGFTTAGGNLLNGITLTAPSKQTLALYATDAFQGQKKNDTSHFLLIDLDSGVKNASIINVQQ